MVKIRLRRVGAKKQPSYRIVVADSRSPRDGRFIEVIGFYNPRTEPETVTLQEERALHWLRMGAQPTAAVARLLERRGTMARLERLKQGEALEALVAEVEKAAQALPAASPKTRREPAKGSAAAAEAAPVAAEETAGEGAVVEAAEAVVEEVVEE